MLEVRCHRLSILSTSTSGVLAFLYHWFEAVPDRGVNWRHTECDVTRLDESLVTDLLLPGPEPRDIAGVTFLSGPEVTLQPRPPLQPLPLLLPHNMGEYSSECQWRLGWNDKLFWAKFSKISILWVPSGKNFAIFHVFGQNQPNIRHFSPSKIRICWKIFTHGGE